jgi:hypothetical protein
MKHAQSLPELLADVHCRGPVDVQKKAKAAWKKQAPPDLYEVVKKKFRSLKGMDHEVLEQLEGLEAAIAEAGLEFSVVELAHAIYTRYEAMADRGEWGGWPFLGAAYLFTRDPAFVPRCLPRMVEPETRTFAPRLMVSTLPEAFYDAWPGLREAHPIEKLGLRGNVSGRIGEIVPGIREITITSTSALPAELFHPDLEVLTIHGGKGLTTIPEEIGRATSLRTLTLSCSAKKLPAGLAKVPLRVLDLHVDVATLDVSAWPELVALEVAGKIKKLVGFEKLTKLQTYTQKCRAPLPEALLEMPTLRRIGITFAGLPDYAATRAHFEARGVEVT